MRYIVVTLAMVALLGAANVVKIQTPAVEKTQLTGEPILMPSILSADSDTIYYDDFSPSWGYSPCAGCLGAVRFTPLGPFQLRVVYFDIYNVGGAPDSFYIWVYDTLNGTLLGGPYGMTIPTGFYTIQYDLPETLTFAAGQDFYIVIGPQVGWGLNTLVFDNGTTVFRSYVDFGGTGVWTLETGGDLCLRAGGQYLGGFIDLASVCTFNDHYKFFILDGEDVYLMATLVNNGTDTIFDWQQYFFIRADSLTGPVVYSDVVGSGTYGPIPPGGTVTVTASTPWTATPGYFIAIDSVAATGDTDPANDVTMTELRPYDPSIGNWFLYTDMSAEACFSWVPGNKWATGFKLNCYPVDLDSIAIAFGVSPDTIALDVPIEVWLGMDMPESLLVAGTIDSVFDGYIHLIYFDPPITVDSGMIFIAYPYYEDVNGNSVCLFQDQDLPIAGNNWCVDVTTFQWFTADSTWYEDNSGDWFMWAFFSECAGLCICGDMNGDGFVNMADMSYLAAYLFFGGPPPVDLNCADVNGDGFVNMADMSYLAAYLFFGGPPPNCP
jgi:hypothetical protein